jgi:methionyl-tRNA synthetase
MEQFKFRDALTAVIELARSGNEYLSVSEPWHSIKRNRKDAASAINLCIQLVRSLAILIYPFMPNTSRMIWTELAAEGEVEEQRWDDAGKLLIKPNHRIGEPKTLFHKVNAEQIVQTWTSNPEQG